MLPAWEIKMLEAELEKRKQEREVKDNEAITRLAAYEDSGLSPEEVQELAKAKEEGRLYISPVRVTTKDEVSTVYALREHDGTLGSSEQPEFIDYISEEKVLAFRVTKNGWSLLIDDGFDGEWIKEKDIGYNVFLSREAAEKALGVGK